METGGTRGGGLARALRRAPRAAGLLVGALASLAVLGFTVPAPAPAAAAEPGAAPPETSALPVLDDLRGASAAAARGLPLWSVPFAALPTARETAAFAAGSMAVAVVFVESDGSIDREREDWSRADPVFPGDRRANVLARVQDALTWWNERSPDGSLDVFLPEAGQAGAPRTVTTGYEPITRPTDQFDTDPLLSDASWRWQVMKKLGYGHDAKDDRPRPETVYADDVRSGNGADWAFVLYVVDSLKDKDGAFPDGAIAYTSDLYGPYMVLTYDNDGYGFANFDAVLAHEMGHVFGALDEYAPPAAGYPSTGELTSGYLGVRNRNAVQGGSTDLPCIMRGSQETLDAYRLGELCPSSVGQAGFRDDDADQRPNVIDTRPLFRPGLPASQAGGVVVLGGTVSEQPWPHGFSSVPPRFTHDVSIFVPHDLQYRVDGGEWLPLTPVDGAFDKPSERWTLTTPALTAGTHSLELQGTTGETASLVVNVVAVP